MKETPLSNCERRFLLRAIEEKKVRGNGGFGRRLGLPAGWTPVARGFIVNLVCSVVVVWTGSQCEFCPFPRPQANVLSWPIPLSRKPPIFVSAGGVGDQDQTDKVATHKYVKGINVCLQRLDGRQTYDYRNIRISFGTDYGCCIVELGKTR